jgi:hypothetical protein
MKAARVFLLAAGAALALLAGAASAESDLALEVSVAPAEGASTLVAGAPGHAVVQVSNLGPAGAPAFEVDVTVSDGRGAVVLAGHPLQVPPLAPGANVTIADNVTFTVLLAGEVRIFGNADPAERVNDTLRANNHDNATAYFGPPPATRTVEDFAGKASGTRTLPPYSYLAFKLDLSDGDTLILQADAEGGALFDCYLMDAENYARYREAREAPAGAVSFIRDYSRNGTDHIAYTAEPMPPGTYYLVLENDERLQHGATPVGPVTVGYALATVNNSLPAWSVAVVIGAAAAAVWATVRWRPHFDVRSPILGVPPPDPAEISDENFEGEGEPPGPPGGEAPPVPPPRPPRA